MDLSNLIYLATEAATEAAPHAVESGGVLGTLGINWELFVAQLLNFTIVVFILWRWVFRPVGGALEKRRQKIEESVKKAEEIETRMREFEAEREEKMRQARAEAAQVMQEALNQSQKMREDATKTAGAEAEKILADAHASIEAEKEKVLQEIKEEAAGLVVRATEKVIKVKLSEGKDGQLVEDAVRAFK